MWVRYASPNNSLMFPFLSLPSQPGILETLGQSPPTPGDSLKGCSLTSGALVMSEVESSIAPKQMILPWDFQPVGYQVFCVMDNLVSKHDNMLADFQRKEGERASFPRFPSSIWEPHVAHLHDRKHTPAFTHSSTLSSSLCQSHRFSSISHYKQKPLLVLWLSH